MKPTVRTKISLSFWTTVFRTNEFNFSNLVTGTKPSKVDFVLFEIDESLSWFDSGFDPVQF